MVQFSLIWLICSAAFILSDWILSIWESGTVGRIDVQAGGEQETGRWCFIVVMGCAMASSEPRVLPQDEAFKFRHNGLDIKIHKKELCKC